MKVIAINRSEALAILENGTSIHFSNMFDAFGDETSDALECVSAVAPMPDGSWVAIDLNEFEPVTRQ